MRLPILAVSLFVAIVAIGCGSKSSSGDKDKKDDDKGALPVPVAAATKADIESPIEKAARAFVIDLRKPESLDLNRVTTRFLKVIGKPLTPNADDQARKYSVAEAQQWLRRMGDIVADGQVFPTVGFVRDGAAVFVGSYSSKGHYLIRIVDEGGVWKLDWFQVAGVEAKDPPTELDPFKDFAAQAAADLLSGGPMTPQDRAPLAAALWSANVRTAQDVNQPEDSTGRDYKRDQLAAKLEAFLGGKVESYLRSAPGTDTFKTEFSLAGGGKKTVEFKIAKGDGPGNWIVEEIKPQ